jgi:hypothetical protein
VNSDEKKQTTKQKFFKLKTKIEFLISQVSTIEVSRAWGV